MGVFPAESNDGVSDVGVGGLCAPLVSDEELGECFAFDEVYLGFAEPGRGDWDRVSDFLCCLDGEKGS